MSLPYFELFHYCFAILANPSAIQPKPDDELAGLSAFYKPAGCGLSSLRVSLKTFKPQFLYMDLPTNQKFHSQCHVFMSIFAFCFHLYPKPRR